MKEKYNYFSKLSYIALIVCIVNTSLFFDLFETDQPDIVLLIVLFFVFVIALPLFTVVFFTRVPAFFIAGKKSVSFGIIRFVTNRIYYDKITDIEITHEFRSPNRYHYYEEIIKFICDDSEYIFRRKMDEIDLRAAAKDPSLLKEQFNNGKFVRLKNYICEKKQNA